jgi:hypothetical protein
VVSWRLLLVLAACGSEPPATYHFDGHRVGEPLAAFLATQPYSTACRGSKLDEVPGLIQFPATDCFQRPGSAFPDATSVGLVGDPVRAVVWIGGTYVAKHSDFPLAIGATEAEIAAKLGPVEQTFDVVRRLVHFHVRRHRGGAYSFVDRTAVVAFAVGELPSDPADPIWTGLNYLHMMTPPSAALAKASSASNACMPALIHAFELLHPHEMAAPPSGSPPLQQPFNDAWDDCDRNRPAAFVDCLNAATTAAAVTACMAGPSW